MSRELPQQKSAVQLQQAEVAQLLKQIAEGDAASLEELYDNYSGLLMSVISSVINVRAEAEEVLQEVFITIWKKAGQYQSHLGKPVSWLVTVAKNKAYDRYRSLVRRTEGNDKIKEAALLQENGADSFNGFENEAMNEAMKSLSADQRSAIELIFIDGLTQKEAAEHLGIPIGTVKARTRRGLQSLKNSYTIN